MRRVRPCRSVSSTNTYRAATVRVFALYRTGVKLCGDEAAIGAGFRSTRSRRPSRSFVAYRLKDFVPCWLLVTNSTSPPRSTLRPAIEAWVRIGTLGPTVISVWS